MQLTDKSKGLFVLTLLCITVVLVVAVFTICKFVLKFIEIFKHAHLKIGNNEVALTKETSNKEEKNSNTSLENLISNVESMVNLATETAYAKSRKRQELFDTQMHYLQDNLNNYRSQVMRDLREDKIQDLYDQDTINIILQNVLNQEAVIKMKSIFIEDRLASINQEDLIDRNKGFIDSLPGNLSREIERRLAISSSKDLKNQVKSTLEKFEKSLQNALSSTLESAWKEAKNYLKIVTDYNKELEEKLTLKAKNIVCDTETFAKNNWLEPANVIPPLDIVARAGE